MNDGWGWTMKRNEILLEVIHHYQHRETNERYEMKFAITDVNSNNILLNSAHLLCEFSFHDQETRIVSMWEEQLKRILLRIVHCSSVIYSEDEISIISLMWTRQSSEKFVMFIRILLDIRLKDFFCTLRIDITEVSGENLVISLFIFNWMFI